MSWLTFSVDSFNIASFHNDSEVEQFITKNGTYSPEYFKDLLTKIKKGTKFYHLCCVLADLDEDVEIAMEYINKLGGFENFAEEGLIRNESV